MTAPKSDLSRHEEYYIPQGDLHFKAGGKRFRVHSYFFTRESEYWKQLLKPPVSPGDDKKTPGLHERDPFLVEENAENFAAFLFVFYNQNYGLYHLPLDKWTAILRLATKWDFPHVQSFAVSRIDKMEMKMAEKIKLYQDYSVPRAYLLPLYIKLVTREQMPDQQEFGIIESNALYAIFKARDSLLRAPPTHLGTNTPLSPRRPDIKEETKLDIVATAFGISPQEIRAFRPPVAPTDTRDPPPVARN